MVAVSSASVHRRMDHPVAALDLQGTISFDNTDTAASDFGNIYHHTPAAVVFPASVDDISKVVRCAARSSTLTVAARGNGHSINGQAQALNGVVIDMSSLKGIEIYVGKVGELSYADVSGGELWIDVLKACLSKGFAPRSWPDYLYLSIGGTLQNAGVGGQTFRYGPAISNVLQLEVVTGKSEVRTCSPALNPDLFFASLGGLGQFGIVSKARIVLANAPQKVRWIRVLYADVGAFTHDQELLISLPEEQTFDYLEGFVLRNNNDPVNGWGQVPLTADKQVDGNLIPPSSGPVLYCLELAKHYNDEDEDTVEQVSSCTTNLGKYYDTALLFQYRFSTRSAHCRRALPLSGGRERERGICKYILFLCTYAKVFRFPQRNQLVDAMLYPLRFIPNLRFSNDVSYFEFLNRVSSQEVTLRSQGLWEAPHPWLCLFVPRSSVEQFDAVVFKKKLTRGVGGPIHLYPMLRSKWDRRTSVVIPDEDIFYLVSFLRFSPPPPDGPHIGTLLVENAEILQLSHSLGISFTMYMPHFASHLECCLHFGSRWQHFVSLKQVFDPLGILAPGQHIFSRVASLMSSTHSNTSITSTHSLTHDLNCSL